MIYSARNIETIHILPQNNTEKMIKTVILDFDGTLGDTKNLIVHTMQQTLQQLCLPPRSDRQCASMIGLPLRQTFTDLMPMSSETADRCVETYTKLFFANNRPGAVPLFLHVIETLDALHRRGITLTIASSRSRQTLVAFLKEMRLEQHIPYVVSANDVENAKPAPDMVVKTLNDLQLNAAECLVVGDTHYDIRMAHQAGVRAVGVTYGNGTREELQAENAEWIIDDFAQLLTIVAEA